MAKVVITKNKLDSLANSIAAKSGVPVTLTLNQMKTAVDSILVPSGTLMVTENGIADVKAYENIDVDVPVPDVIDQVSVKSTSEEQVIAAGTIIKQNVYVNWSASPIATGITFENKKYYIDFTFDAYDNSDYVADYVADVKQIVDFTDTDSVELEYIDRDDRHYSPGFSERITSITLNKNGNLSYTYAGQSEDFGMEGNINVIKILDGAYATVKVERLRMKTVNVVPSETYQVITPGYSDDVMRTVGTLDLNETLNSTGQLPSFDIPVDDFQRSNEMGPFYDYRISGQIDISDRTSSISIGIDTMFRITIGAAYKKIPYEIISVNDEYHGWGQQYDLKINYSTQNYIYLILESFIIGSPGGTTVSAHLTITENYPCDALSGVQVEPIPSNYIQPSGTISITSNGTVDVSQYENASVNVSGAVGIADVTSTLANGATQHSITAVDLSNDTVDASHLASGYTAHNSSGQAVTGTMESANLTTKTITPSDETQYVVGYNYLDRLRYTQTIQDRTGNPDGSANVDITSDVTFIADQKYRVIGKINVRGPNSIILETYNVDAIFTWNTTRQNIFEGDSDTYYYYFKTQKAGSNFRLIYSYQKTAKYGFDFNCCIYEQTNYDGLSKVTVNPVPDTYYSPDYMKDMITRSSSFTTFKFPDGITSIGPYAFTYCSHLALTSLPSSIVSIGQYAFAYCTSLALTSLPSNLTSNILQYTFYGCTNLALTSLPSGIVSIGQYAFYGCTNLALTSLPSGLTTINSYTFFGCTNLALTSLPSDITSINGYAFYGCASLALTSLPSGTTTISGYAFYDCTNLALTSLPSSITGISSYAFKNCTGLTTLSCTGVITTLGSQAFLGDSSNHMQLISVRFPNLALTSGISTVFGSSTAAAACQELEICDIGKTASISANAFANCYKLQTLILRKTTVCTLGNTSAFTNTPLSGYNGLTATVYVPSSLISSYQTASNWSTLYNAGNVTFSAIEGSDYELD